MVLDAETLKQVGKADAIVEAPRPARGEAKYELFASVVELATEQEPRLNSPGQCVRLVDVNRDGRLDIILSKTVTVSSPKDPGGWSVFLNLP